MTRRTFSLLGLSFVMAAGCADLRLHRLTPQAQAFRDVAPAPDAPRELAKVLHPTHVVEAGDVLLVQPTDLDSPVRLCTDQPVLADGTIDLGMYGRPVVAGKPVSIVEAEVQQLIRAKIPGGEAININVRIIDRHSKVFYVLGEVVHPGAYPVKGNEAALDAIVAAGGLTCRASELNIILSRPTGPCEARDVKPICYRQIVQLGDTTTNYQIMPGDRIYVPSRTLLERINPDGCGRRKCGPCMAPQVLKPMPRPGCPVEICTPTAACAGGAACAGKACAGGAVCAGKASTTVAVSVAPSTKCEKCDKTSPTVSKADDGNGKRSGLFGWGCTGCIFGRKSNSSPSPSSASGPMVPGEVFDGVIFLQPAPSTTGAAGPVEIPPLVTPPKAMPTTDVPLIPVVDPKLLPSIPVALPALPPAPRSKIDG